MKRLLIVLLLTWTLPVSGQTTDFQTLLSGKEPALSIRLGDLNSDWRAMSLTVAGGGGNGMGSLLSSLLPLGMMAGAGGGGGSSDAMMGMAVLSGLFSPGSGGTEPVYYTQGKTVTIGAETLLIAYRYTPKPLDIFGLIQQSAMNGGKEPDFTALSAQNQVTADTRLSLSLLNLRSISAFSNIHAFDLEQELKANNGGNALWDILKSSQEKKAPAKPGNTKAQQSVPTRQARKTAARN